MIEKKCEQILEKYHDEKGSVISILQDMQESFGYIREDAMDLYGFLNKERYKIAYAKTFDN